MFKDVIELPTQNAFYYYIYVDQDLRNVCVYKQIKNYVMKILFFTEPNPVDTSAINIL